MEAKFGVCVDCGREESGDCPMYICMDDNGLVVVCCLVYFINNNLTILKCLDRPTDRED